MENSLNRYISAPIRADLQHKMVFIGGPRQVGKTTLALSLLPRPRPKAAPRAKSAAPKSAPRANASRAKSPRTKPAAPKPAPPLTVAMARHPGYLNWDNPAARPPLLRGELPGGQRRIVLDEIHKHPKWRNLVKGLYDSNRDRVSFVVTGSARLDHYRKGGDSLHGRYHYYRLHPLSLREMNRRPRADDLRALLEFGGFPEPLLAHNARVWRRWQRERLSRVIYEDVRDLEQVREIGLIELLVEALPMRVGAPLSVANLREDLGVAHATVERYLAVLENMYVCFRLPPYSGRSGRRAAKIRAVKKERKLYLWDWSQVADRGARFENLVASQLLKYCHFVEDTEGYAMDLRFIRDTDRREVDFVVLQGKKPLFAVECKTGEKAVSPAIHYFRARTDIPAFYQVHAGSRDYLAGGVRVLPFTTFCAELALP